MKWNVFALVFFLSTQSWTLNITSIKHQSKLIEPEKNLRIKCVINKKNLNVDAIIFSFLFRFTHWNGVIEFFEHLIRSLFLICSSLYSLFNVQFCDFNDSIRFFRVMNIYARKFQANFYEIMWKRMEWICLFWNRIKSNKFNSFTFVYS